MSVFTEQELAYLHPEPEERRLGRLATVGPDGMPHVAPVGWSHNPDHDTIDIGGRALESTRKYRDARKTGRAAIVIDDVLPPWKPRGIEVRGRAEVVEHPVPLIRIHPRRIVSWGIEDDTIGKRFARTVDSATAPEGDS